MCLHGNAGPALRLCLAYLVSFVLRRTARTIQTAGPVYPRLCNLRTVSTQGDLCTSLQAGYSRSSLLSPPLSPNSHSYQTAGEHLKMKMFWKILKRGFRDFVSGCILKRIEGFFNEMKNLLTDWTFGCSAGNMKIGKRYCFSQEICSSLIHAYLDARLGK